VLLTLSIDEYYDTVIILNVIHVARFISSGVPHTAEAFMDMIFYLPDRRSCVSAHANIIITVGQKTVGRDMGWGIENKWRINSSPYKCIRSCYGITSILFFTHAHLRVRRRVSIQLSETIRPFYKTKLCPRPE